MKTTKIIVVITARFGFTVAAIAAAVVIISTNSYTILSQPFIFPHQHQLATTTTTTNNVSQIQFKISELQTQLDHYKVLQTVINDNITAIQNQISSLQTQLAQAKQQEQQAETQAINKLVVGILHFYNTDKCYNTHIDTNGTGYTLQLTCGHIKSFNSTTVTGSFNVTVAS